MIANIVPEKRTGQDKEIYSYLIPNELVSEVRVGSIVKVSFGRYFLRGVVVELTKEIAGDFKLKLITSIEKSFMIPDAYIRVAKWIAEYYLCSLGEAVPLFLPPEMIRPKKAKPVDRQMVNRTITLNADQKAVFEQLAVRLHSNEYHSALIHGVTSSGKTEVYLELAKEAINAGKQVVVLVPEIILTPQTVERFVATFGDLVAVMHSELSKSERLKSYEDFYAGAKPILIGPRSALLVPSEKIGLIIVDEEAEGAYKQEKNPKYHAVRVAEQIARETHSLLIMGSATPSIETYYRAQQGEISLFELRNRYNESAMPETTVVDLRNEIRSKNFSPISLTLQEAIAEALDKKKQIFLFLNRRGSSTFISCRECGEVILCPNCAIPVVYHTDEMPPYLSCHHCDHRDAVPYRCPTCGGYKIKHFGSGVEKIEAEIHRLFPVARVRRVDSSTLTSKKDYQTIYDQLKAREIDIVIGTQIIAKGLDLPGVSLVGVVSADVGLHLPYYKAGERVFGLLTQVSGRSGRGQDAGRTIIQTYWPESRAILAAKDHNYREFYDAEIIERKKFDDPPFSHVVRVIAEEKGELKAKGAIEKVAKELSVANIDYAGPAKPFLSKLRGKYRYHLIIKVKTLPNEALTSVFERNQYLFWDVDPENLL